MPALLALLLVAAGCRARTPVPAPTVVVTVPVVETRVIEVTREIPVTPTPSPTPVYSSPVNSPAGVLTYPLDEAPVYLDPHAASTAAEELVVGQIYEGLFNLRGDGRLEPAAASAYETSVDTRVFTVTLRSGLTWSDGVPLSASDYVAGFCRALEPAVGNPAARLVGEAAPVTGAAAYASGETADCAKVGVTAVNTNTLSISLDAPAAHLPSLMATSLFFPAPPNTGPITQTVVLTATAGLPANGPFTLAEVGASRLVLQKNQRYWNANAVTIERVELPIMPDTALQLEGYLEGDLQASRFPTAARPRIEGLPSLAAELHALPVAGVSYLAFNTRRTPTDNVLVRRAIGHAIDRERLLVEVLQQPWHTAAVRLFAPGPADASPADPYDPERARQLLSEAGYGEENPVPVIELWYNREGNNEALFKAIVAMLEDVGIPVRAVSSTWEMYSEALSNCAAAEGPAACPFNMYRGGYLSDYPDSSSLLRALSPRSTDQYTGWASEEFDGLLSAAAAEQSEARRSELFRRAEALLVEKQAVLVPLFYYDRSVLVKAGLTFEFPAWGPPHLGYWGLRR